MHNKFSNNEGFLLSTQLNLPLNDVLAENSALNNKQISDVLFPAFSLEDFINSSDIFNYSWLKERTVFF